MLCVKVYLESLVNIESETTCLNFYLNILTF